MPRLCEVYPGICLTTEEKARKNLSQGSRRMPVGTTISRCVSLISLILHLFQTFLGPNVFLSKLLAATSNRTHFSKVS